MNMLNHYLDRVPEYVRQQTGKRDLPNLARSSEGATHRLTAEVSNTKKWIEEQSSGLQKAMSEKRHLNYNCVWKKIVLTITPKERKLPKKNPRRKKPLDSELKEEASSLQIDADNATRKMNQLNEKIKKTRRCN